VALPANSVAFASQVYGLCHTNIVASASQVHGLCHTNLMAFTS
jgi:hypothetical protein